MTDQLHFVSASSFALAALADIFTRSFEEYFYPGTTTGEILAQRVRVEQIDLHRSLVMLLGDEPVGLALLARRGDRAWCGGFGVVLPLRGRGLSHQLAVAMLEQARQANARRFSLEVLTRNERAIKTYIRLGMRTRRDLQILEWRRSEDEPENKEQGTKNREAQHSREMSMDDGRRTIDVVEVEEPARLLDRFAALHPAPAAWQRDLPSLLTRGGFRGLGIEEAGMTAAYAIYQANADGIARIEDLGAQRTDQAVALLAALQARSQRIVTVNEPTDSPLTTAFLSAGFTEIDRQHEMWMDL
jgi:RimJ/RimL family protein N-acetyltransferase